MYAGARSEQGVKQRLTDSSLDQAGNLYFISLRSHSESLSTLYRGRLKDGEVTDVRLVAGISRRKLGIVMFDAKVSADGSTLFVVNGELTGGPIPKTADIEIAVPEANGFLRQSFLAICSSCSSRVPET